MTELLTAARMRAIEQAAIATGSVTGLDLMTRAGAGVVDAILAEWPELALTSHRAVVLCGPGNNGGDGFVIARLLHERGWDLALFLYGAPETLPPDARASHDRWSALGPTTPIGFPNPGAADLESVRTAIEGNSRPAALIVDALFGTGLTRAAEGLAPIFGLIRDLTAAHIVAVDVPTGLCAESGRTFAPSGQAPGPALLRADLTVTFHGPKLGHYLGRGPAACGRLRVAGIGLLPPDETAPDGPILCDPTTRRLGKRGDGHKYHHGHAVIVSGPSPQGGAARLAARGALRVGAGLVTVAAPPDAVRDHAAQLTAIMLHEIDGPDALAGMLRDARLNALCLGPGLGTGEAAADLVAVVLDAARGADATGAGGSAAGQPAPGRSLVLDADALTILARRDDLSALLHPACVLTPHAGEFARLFPDLAERLNAPAARGPAYSKLDATRDAAARAGCTVLLKGPDTVIADQTGAARICAAAYDRAAPWLATAGAGDVLSGLIAGLLARGLPPIEAAAAAAWLHVECALTFGPGLIAEDIPEELPEVFRSLGI